MNETVFLYSNRGAIIRSSFQTILTHGRFEAAVSPGNEAHRSVHGFQIDVTNHGVFLLYFLLYRVRDSINFIQG